MTTAAKDVYINNDIGILLQIYEHRYNSWDSTVMHRCITIHYGSISISMLQIEY